MYNNFHIKNEISKENSIQINGQKLGKKVIERKLGKLKNITEEIKLCITLHIT